jgi:S-DNA-T family DNA segregation ATPase FtsK/SpoIIIE
MTAFLGRRGVEVIGLILIAIGLACVAALASYDPTDPSAVSGWRATLSGLIGWPGAVTADHLYRSMGAASWLPGLLFVGWGWQLGTRKQLNRPGQLLIVAPLVLGLASLALAVLRPFPDWPHTNVLNGGVIGDVLYEALIPKATAVIGLDVQWIGLLVALLAVAGLHVALGGSINLKQWVDRATGAFHQLRGPRAGSAGSDSRHDVSQPVTIAATAPRRGKAAEKRSKSRRQTRADFGPAKDYRLPALKLLAAPPTGGKRTGGKRTGGKKAVSQNKELTPGAELVESALAEFGVKGKVVEIRPGPVVTLYEFQPAPGVKASQVVGLANDIARSLGADSARIAALPGRKVLGIEIPNKVRELVPLRELLASDDYANAPPGLTLALGKDIGGGPVVADLAAMPHLLVAGTTGSGKSVGISTMILSLLYRLTPNQCRFIMIDPKMLELTAFDGIPHLLAPVVTDPDEAVAALDWTLREMEFRYQAMSDLGVRNIAGYNARLEKTREQESGGGQGESDPEMGEPAAGPAHPLPHIVVVVDEIADLMLTAGKEVETAVQRIAQMARAAGIHLVMATQRPSSDVITGTIKANFPTRISFQVTSKIDSRTVLGEGGAEQLLGQGDMLYMAGGGRFIRVHGAFISDEEVETVVRFLKDQGEPVYIDAVTEGEGLAEAASPRATPEPGDAT